MSDQHVIWIVTSGAYSDYAFVCAFTTKALAEAYADRINHKDWERQRGPEWDWLYNKPGQHEEHTFERYMEYHGDQYGLRAERCQLWDRLPLRDYPRYG